MRLVIALSLASIGFQAVIGNAAETRKVQSAKTSTISLPALKWQNSFTTALQVAGKTRKPILLEFFADWSQPCHYVQEVVWQDDRVRLLGGEFVLVRLDVDGSGKSLAQKYNVSGIPSWVFINSSGKELKRFDGAELNEEFPSTLSLLAGVLQSQRSAALGEASFATPHDAVILARLAALQAMAGNRDEANAFLSRAIAEDPDHKNSSVLAARHILLTTAQYR